MRSRRSRRRSSASARPIRRAASPASHCISQSRAMPRSTPWSAPSRSRVKSIARCGTRSGRTRHSRRRSRSALPRKAYLDWLRGVAVIVMVAAHVTDAWTRVEDRQRQLYGYTVIIAGLAAPLFLFLAGLTLSMAASLRANTVGHRAAATMALKRGVQIFALAFLFRLQSQLLGWGPLVNFLKVDILNVMGVTMSTFRKLTRDRKSTRLNSSH